MAFELATSSLQAQTYYYYPTTATPTAAAPAQYYYYYPPTYSYQSPAATYTPQYYQVSYPQTYQPTYATTGYETTYATQPAQPAAQPAAVQAPPATIASDITTQAPAPTYAGDPYGFTNWLNSTRAAYGLSPVGYDPNLAGWAAANNDQQAARGMGHFVMGPASRQNSAVGSFPGVESMWMASPAHRAALLDPTIRWIGIAGLGAYWTFNAN